jgi:predicted oxidoreductase
MTTMSHNHDTIEAVPLGKSGIIVSPIAWGMWRFGSSGVDEARALIEAVLAVGITLFDTADIYGFNGTDGFGDAEALLGRLFAEAPELRGQMVLATKGGIMPPLPYDSSAAYLAKALDASLARLNVEQVDLYQIHRPDILAHPQEAARALEDMVTSGKVRAIGVSNYNASQIRALAAYLTVPLASHQPEFSALRIDPMVDGLFDQAMEMNMAVLAWSPLGGGRLGDPKDDVALRVAAVLDRKAAEAGVSRAVAAYSWIMAHPARVIPIVGTQNPTRVAELADVHKPKWTRQDWYEVLVAARGEPLP